jgi:nitroreductase
MPDPNPAALEFLQNRRSRPAKTLTTPVPDRDELKVLLETAARTPDHGKLEPWRFIVLEKPALQRLSQLVITRGAELQKSQVLIDRSAETYGEANLVVVVVSSPKESNAIPVIEQTYSAGAVCLALLNACLAAGWGANWLSGWASHDRGFLREGLGLADHEHAAAMMHIGTETSAPPERPRPDMEAITEWRSE